MRQEDLADPSGSYALISLATSSLSLVLVFFEVPCSDYGRQCGGGHRDHHPDVAGRRKLEPGRDDGSHLTIADNICELLDGLNSARTICDLAGKRLQSLSAGDCSELSTVRILYLYNNSLTTLPDNVFAGLSNLEKLYLGPYDSFSSTNPVRDFWRVVRIRDTNPLRNISSDAFKGLSKLQHLSDRKAPTGERTKSPTSLPEDVFDGLSNLVGLDLYGNKLTSLPENIFDGLSNLRSLWLQHNELTCLPKGIFDGFSPKVLGTSRNKFKESPPTCAGVSFSLSSGSVSEDVGTHNVTVNLNPARPPPTSACPTRWKGRRRPGRTSPLPIPARYRWPRGRRRNHPDNGDCRQRGR